MFRLLYFCLLLCGLAVAFVPQPAHAAVVFSNMSGADNIAVVSQTLAVVFDVPAGADYQINSIQLRLTFADTVNLSLHSDNAGLPGAVVVDLGSQVVAGAVNTYTFTPVGTTTLPGGGRYWLVLTQPALNVYWVSDVPAGPPTGVFTFVANGRIGAGTFAPIANRFKLAIDADSIAVSSNAQAADVPACINADGRVNSICNDPAQTAAIYCNADGSIDVYGITENAGWLAFRVTQSEIDAVGIPTENTRIAASEDSTIRLYRLSTGELQVNAPYWDSVHGNLPNGYTFIWQGC